MFTLNTEEQPPKSADPGMTNGGFELDDSFEIIHGQSPNSRLPSEQTLEPEESSMSHNKSSFTSVENVQIEYSDSPPSNQTSPNVAKVQSKDHTNWKRVDLELQPVVKSSPEEIEKSSEETDTAETPLDTIVVVEQRPPPKAHLDQSKLNEISSVDDVKHTCVERREPNGTTYFVEVDMVPNGVPATSEPLNQNADVNQSYQPTEFMNGFTQEMEKSMMESVLNQSDVEFKPDPKPPIERAATPVSEDSQSEDELEVRAIVHAPNGHFSPFGTPPTTPGVIRPIDPVGRRAQTLRLPNFQIGIYEAIPKQKLLFENDKNRRAFKRQLEHLFSRNDETLPNRTKSNFNSPISKRMTFDSKHLNHSISAPESLDIPLDEITSKQPSIDVMASKIPQPPAFNQHIYDTIGRRNRKVLSVASDVIDIDSPASVSHVPPEPVAVMMVKKGNLSRTKAHENLTELDNDEVPNIKQKLESIFSRGQTTQVTNVAELDDNQNQNIRWSKRMEPFDTVRMQKQRFNNVLKSIGPDNHANLHPTQTTAAIDIHEMQRRESLNLNEMGNNPLKTL